MHVFPYYLLSLLCLCKDYVSAWLCVCVCVCENQVSVGVSHQPKLSSVCHQSVLNCVYAFLPLPHLPSWCCDKSVFLICLDAFPCQQVIPKVVNSVGAQGSDIFLGIWLQLLMLGWLMSYFYQHLGSMFICVHAHTHTHTHTHQCVCVCFWEREREGFYVMLFCEIYVLH